MGSSNATITKMLREKDTQNPLKCANWMLCFTPLVVLGNGVLASLDADALNRKSDYISLKQLSDRIFWDFFHAR